MHCRGGFGPSLAGCSEQPNSRGAISAERQDCATVSPAATVVGGSRLRSQRTLSAAESLRIYKFFLIDP